MRKVLIIIVMAVMSALTVLAQNTMRINYGDGNHIDIPLSKVDSVTFVNAEENPLGDNKLIGQWLWGDKDRGYYELITFNEDGTFTGYDRFFQLDMTNNSYGTYTRIGNILNLRCTIQGYESWAGRTYNYQWLILSLTDTDLELMTEYENETYHRVQNETLSVKYGGTLECTGDDYFAFVDGEVLSGSAKKLTAISRGTTYILKYLSAKGCTLAYKVVVE